MLNRLLSITILLLLLSLSCTDPPDYPNEPVIELIGLDNNRVLQGDGVLKGEFARMTISFTDGDGDLGGIDGVDTSFVYIRDPRYLPPQDLQTIAFPKVPELGTGNGVSGEAAFRFSVGCCFFPGQVTTDCSSLVGLGYPQDTVTFLVSVSDRNGNVSNVLETPLIFLLCE